MTDAGADRQTTSGSPPSSLSSSPWLSRIRLRVAVFVIGIPLATLGAISVSPAWLTLPLVGVAFAAVTMTINKLTHRLSAHTCLTCGGDLSELAPHENGVICPGCGALNQHRPSVLAMTHRADDADDQASDA